MLLDGKTAIIFGAGGAIGGAVAKAFAHEGARVFLSGRHGAPVEAVANDSGVLGLAASLIDHIGSTAAPALAARPIIAPRSDFARALSPPLVP
ncbi:MAG: SDR family NAD(P)-dependent oxidoreductase [Thermomicrobiales bacterium]